MWLLLAFIAVPLIEIALFIQVGGAIGLWPTLLIVVVTAILGTSLVRSQGALAIRRLKSSFNELRDPSEPLADGAMILFAGALLLTPGFFTDACGFALLVPGIRKRIFLEVKKRVKVETVHYGNPGVRPRPSHGRGTVIDGNAEEIEITEPDPNRRPSGWTRTPPGGRSGRN
ncbi:FxsA family protein [Palleronia sp.]|uniref:FxsA family protein n=1 Tax=Palleronia sp. TaxID=1940284 RepID=UPI0035C8521D